MRFEIHLDVNSVQTLRTSAHRELPCVFENAQIVAHEYNQARVAILNNTTVPEVSGVPETNVTTIVSGLQT